LCHFQKAGKETRFFLKPGFSLTQTANLSKLGLEEQSVKPQIKLSRGAENRLRELQKIKYPNPIDSKGRKLLVLPLKSG